MKGSIQKRWKTYYVVFRVIDPDTGKRSQKWIPAGPSKHEAERKYIELMGEVHDGNYKDLKKATFKEFAETWLRDYAKMKCKPSTYRGYENTINKQLIPRFGSFKLSDVTTGRLQTFIAERSASVKRKTVKSETGNSETVETKTLKPKTVINDIVPIKLMFKHAVRWGYLKKDPAEYIERPKIEREEVEILTPEEVNLLLKHMSPQYRTLILTAVLTGLRRGELLGLQWGDIDGRHNQIHVRRAFCNVSKELTTPKTRRSKRKVDMSPTLVKELKALLMASGTRSATALIFTEADGSPIDPDNFYHREFVPALQRAKLRRVGVHSLRHTNVSLRIEQGQSILYISRQIGHSSAKTTLDIYGHLFKEVNTEQAEKLDAILGFVEQPGNSSDACGRLWKVSAKIKEKGIADELQPLDLIGSGGRI